MEYDKETNIYKSSKDLGTGSHENFEKYKIIVYPFGKYEIAIRLSLSNEFIDILEVKVNKDFLDYKQKSSLKKYNDIDDYYRD